MAFRCWQKGYNFTQCGNKVQPHTQIQPTSASEGKAEEGGSAETCAEMWFRTGKLYFHCKNSLFANSDKPTEKGRKESDGDFFNC